MKIKKINIKSKLVRQTTNRHHSILFVHSRRSPPWFILFVRTSVSVFCPTSAELISTHTMHGEPQKTLAGYVEVNGCFWLFLVFIFLGYIFIKLIENVIYNHVTFDQQKRKLIGYALVSNIGCVSFASSASCDLSALLPLFNAEQKYSHDSRVV